MIEEFAIVALTLDLYDYDLKSGDTGTVVDVVEGGKAYVVEFMTMLGKTIAVAEVSPGQLRPVQENEIANARQIVTSH